MIYLLRGLAILTSLVTAGEQSPGRESIRYPSFTKNRRVWYGLQRERTTKYLSSFSESVSYTAFQKPVNLETYCSSAETSSEPVQDEDKQQQQQTDQDIYLMAASDLCMVSG